MIRNNWISCSFFLNLHRNSLIAMINVLISAAGLSLATIIGSILGFSIKELPHKWNDAVMGFCAGVMLSASTLKRLWGYVSSNPVPRISTLDILCRYIGKRDFLTFCEHIKKSPEFESSFFTAKFVSSFDLQEGCTVEIGWNPNRVVRLQYLGGSKFKVLSSLNSQLKADDEFEVSSFILGYPLYISRIFRDGEYTPSYIAGSNDGLTILSVE